MTQKVIDIEEIIKSDHLYATDATAAAEDKLGPGNSSDKEFHFKNSFRELGKLLRRSPSLAMPWIPRRSWSF